MMKEEFETLAGYEVSWEDYSNIIEPMYMALETVTKQEFVQMIDRKRFALKTRKEFIKEMKALAEEIMEWTERTGAYEQKEKLQEKFSEFAKRFGLESFYTLDMNTVLGTYRGCSFPVQVVFYRMSYDGKRVCVQDQIDLLPKMIKEYGCYYGIDKTPA